MVMPKRLLLRLKIAKENILKVRARSSGMVALFDRPYISA